MTAGQLTYDVAAVRAHFPALADGTAYFDGPGGSQVPDVVADAIAAALRAGLANRGTVTAAEQRADAIVHQARAAMADLLGAQPNGVVFGRSMTALTYDMSRALAKTWGPGDEVVVTRLDHDANIRPWVQAAAAVGATVRWADFDPETGELAPERITRLLGPRTRLVAVTAASNLLGARPDIPAIAAAAHQAGALVYLDGVHLTPHAPVDIAALGADFYACSPYKFLGPHLGVLAADPALLDTVHPDKLLPSTDAVPERFELGTLPYELLAGTTAAVDFLATLGNHHGGRRADRRGDRRARLTSALTAVERHEGALSARLDRGLRERGAILYGAPDRRRTPTTLFAVNRVHSSVVQQRLAAAGVNAPAGSFYAIECANHLGLGAAGAVRAGIAPYTDESDVDRLLAALDDA